MRRVIAILVTTLLLAGVLICPIAAEEQPVFSLEALDQYCNIWNDYHNRYQMNLYGGYNIAEDGASLSGLCITYNGDHNEVDYGTDIIPSTASLFFVFEPDQSIYGFCVFSDKMKSDLEKAVIYADDMVINDLFAGSSHKEGSDMWSISLIGEELLDLYSKNEFTLRLTVDGKSEIIDISHDKQEYLYDMVTFLIRGQLYSNTNSDRYLSSELLPGGIRSTATATPVPTEAPYSFREDYDAIDQTAKSLFYVETYNKKDECLASASGFVTFEEHLFVTNQHVIDGAAYLKVWDDDNNMFVIDKVVASDAKKDIAILLFPEGKNYNSLEQNADEELKRGQPVVTIGSPKGFQNSVAFGNISAFPEENGIRYIQFTAPISHGSSGGCLFDDSGKVIGITTAGMEEGQNLNFAVPIIMAQDLYVQWNKTDYEPLGSAHSWDMVGVTPSPIPTPSPTPEPQTVETLPTGVYLNRYGIIKDYVNFRLGPTMDYALAGEPIIAGEYVYLIINVKNSKGEIWSRVKYYGKNGYIKSDHIYAISMDESNAYNVAQSSPAPVYTATPEPTTIPEMSDTLPVGVFINRYGITVRLVNFRSGPSVDYPPVTEPIEAGEYVYLIFNEINSQNEIWTKVNINGMEGYIKGDNIYVIDKEDSDAYNMIQNTLAPVYDVSPTPDPIPIEPGECSDRVRNLLEKLYDMSYIPKLSEDHDLYETKYVKSIMKAEKALDFEVDGIISPKEYSIFMLQEGKPPAAPAKLNVKKQEDGILLTWSKVPGAISYDILYEGKVIRTTDKTSWVHNIDIYKTVEYSVRAKKYTVWGKPKTWKGFPK